MHESGNGWIRALSLLPALLTAGGCATLPPPQQDYRPTIVPAMVPPPQTDGSIYQNGYGMALFEDIKARRVGDVLTILLAEQTQASKKAATSTKKDTNAAIEAPTIMGGDVKFNLPGSNKLRTLEQKLQSAQDFSGEGDSSQSNSLSGRITVTVAEVLPNGNLLVRGEKWLTLNQGDEYIQISGIVRPVDIATDNTVLSTQVADARITYAGRGTLADANSMGWLARFFNSPYWPF